MSLGEVLDDCWNCSNGMAAGHEKVTQCLQTLAWLRERENGFHAHGKSMNMLGGRIAPYSFPKVLE